MLYVLVGNVTISGLVLRAPPFGASALLAVPVAGLSTSIRNLRIIGNEIYCGGSCIFLIGVPNAVVSDNRFTASGGGTGIQMQQGTSATAATQVWNDSARIERNVILTTRPAGVLHLGAIRPRGGNNMVIRDNQISGPWSNGIATVDVHGSVIERNTVSGATQYGVFIGANTFGPITATGNLVRGNRLDAVKSAMLIHAACNNVFVGNRLTAGGDTPRVFFTSLSGKNVLLGEASTSVDNGEFDCDGDGTIDPNFLSGPGRKAANPGEVVGPVMQHAPGMM